MAGTAAGTAPDRFKRPVSVLVVVSDEEGSVLLLRRTRPDGFWQSVTGSLKPGEAPADAAARELKEETGIEAVPVATGEVRRFPILPAWRSRYDPAVSENEEHRFTVRLERPVAVRLDPREHLEAAWLPRDEAAERAGSWTDREAIRALTFMHDRRHGTVANRGHPGGARDETAPAVKRDK